MSLAGLISRCSTVEAAAPKLTKSSPSDAHFHREMREHHKEMVRYHKVRVKNNKEDGLHDTAAHHAAMAKHHADARDEHDDKYKAVMEDHAKNKEPAAKVPLRAWPSLKKTKAQAPKPAPTKKSTDSKYEDVKNLRAKAILQEIEGKIPVRSIASGKRDVAAYKIATSHPKFTSVLTKHGLTTEDGINFKHPKDKHLKAAAPIPFSTGSYVLVHNK